MGAINRQQAKTRYSDSELEEFRQLIESKLQTAQGQLQFLTNQMEDFVDNPDAKLKGLDDATSLSENEQLFNAASRIKKHIQHLKNALIRVENKVYGICRETGRLIDKKRLMAVPHATLSIDAKRNR